MYNIPIIWRSFITDFLKISVASVFAFVAILLTMRMSEIAHFIALGAPFPTLLLFTLYQVPYILPIALPLSGLIASFIIVRRCSQSEELTALRASGFSLLHILAPIWLVAAFLSLLNFWITSEFATQSHLEANVLKSELRAINPLLLLQNKHLMRLKGCYFEILGSSHVGESATNVVLAIPNQQQNRLHLLLANKLCTEPTHFTGNGVSLIAGTAGEKENDFDDLYIENIGTSVANIQDFSPLLEKKILHLNNDYLKFSFLLSRLRDIQHEVELLLPDNPNAAQLQKEKKYRILSEIMKRFSIALAVFTFTVLGTTCGITIGRRKQYKPLCFAIALTTLFLLSFFFAKEVDTHFWMATFSSF